MGRALSAAPCHSIYLTAPGDLTLSLRVLPPHVARNSYRSQSISELTADSQVDVVSSICIDGRLHNVPGPRVDCNTDCSQTRPASRRRFRFHIDVLQRTLS